MRFITCNFNLHIFITLKYKVSKDYPNHIFNNQEYKFYIYSLYLFEYFKFMNNYVHKSRK